MRGGHWATFGALGTALWWSPVALAVNDTIVGTAVISGTSMSPTLNPDGSNWRDRVIVDKLSTRFYRYQRGDVVLLKSPRQPKALLVKRVIGLEGDWLLAPGKKDIVKIPKGHCWVEGDNTADSEDSASSFGPLPVALIQGRVLAVFWPPSRLHSLGSRVPAGKLLMRNDAAFDVRTVT